MFQSSASRFRSWWSAATADLLGGDLREDARPIDIHLNHPHRRQLGRQKVRRPGSVLERPAVCISPARRERDRRQAPRQPLDCGF
jgi:hypothetical protein